MLHRLFSAATSAAALKGKSLAVEEEEITKSKQLLYGYISHDYLFVDITCSYLPEGHTDLVRDARVLILKDEAGRKDKVFLYDSHGDEAMFRAGRYSPLPKRVISPLRIKCAYQRPIGI
jgi:hypothetical protein